jgi:superoxide dismutase, Fe-Mn family
MNTSRRDFFRIAGGIALAGTLFGVNRNVLAADSAPAGPYTLPELPYAVNALEPHIDAQTMEIHHGKHHAAYVKNLNAALEGLPAISAHPIEDVLRNLQEVPEDKRQAVINNGGGHANHAFFWQIMGPKGGGEPQSDLAKDIAATFGGFPAFQEQFTNAAKTRFGSGWAWLVLDGQGKLQVTSTANQDSPYSQGQAPILALDVWEHAYYLKYQNRRPDYVAAWWNVVNWEKAGAL